MQLGNITKNLLTSGKMLGNYWQPLELEAQLSDESHGPPGNTLLYY